MNFDKHFDIFWHFTFDKNVSEKLTYNKGKLRQQD